MRSIHSGRPFSAPPVHAFHDRLPAVPVIEGELSSYAAEVLASELPPEVCRIASLHILDTIAAGVAGRTLGAGSLGVGVAEAYEVSGPATVWGSGTATSPAIAAFANGMAAHADETDDSHQASRTHPGCAVVPACLAVAETRRLSGMELIRSVVFGYDMCTRITRALWPDLIEKTATARVRSTHALGSLFGAAMAAGAAGGMDSREFTHLLGYVAHEVSGLNSVLRNVHRVDKAYVFAGGPAFKAVWLGELVGHGFTGPADPLSGTPGLFGLGSSVVPEALTESLGATFAIEETSFKKYPAASPAQSPLHCLIAILNEEELSREQVAEVVVRLNPRVHATVTEAAASDVSIADLLEVALRERALPFALKHDAEEFDDWRSPRGATVIEIQSDDSIASRYGAHVRVLTRDGLSYERSVVDKPGSVANPLSPWDVMDKAASLLQPVLGAERTWGIIEGVDGLHELEDVARFREWLLI